MKRTLPLLCFVIALVVTIDARAAITPRHYYRMGENDPGAIPGVAGITRDGIGGKNLTTFGAPFYSLTVGAEAAARVGSVLSMQFFSSTYATGALLTNVTDNFGLEAWVYPNSASGSQVIAYNGNPGSSGFGMRVFNGTWEILYGGVIFIGGGSVAANTWSHVALVRASGNTTLYVNGVPTVTTALAPNPAVGTFTVAAPPSPTGDYWSGFIDELRFFTFSAGQFSTNDLLRRAPDIAVQQPAGSNINDGGSRNFGSVNLGTNTSLTFTITNPGISDLTISGTAIDGADAAHFSVTASPIGNLATNASTSMTVRFSPTSVGTKTAALHLLSNDPEESPFDITLTGFGVGRPEISIEQPAGTPLSVGSVAAWGWNAYGQAAVPSGLTNIQRIAAGGGHSLALKSDGTIAVWGVNDSGQTNIPAGLTNVQAIAAGSGHSMALRGNGTVVAWGYSIYGATNVPAGLANVQAIAAGGNHSLALKNDGTVVAWGNNSDGQTNVPGGLSGVVAIAAGYGHSAALKSDGTVVCWGANNFGQSSVPGGLTGVRTIAAGDRNTGVVLSNGTVLTWGETFGGQSGVPTNATGLQAISVGNSFFTAIRSNGIVLAWGNNGLGELNVPAGLRGGKAVSSGNAHTLALVDSAVDFGGQLIGTNSPIKTFTIKNTGPDPLVISSVSLVGGNTSDFTLNTNGMVTTIPAAGQTTVSVYFTPSVVGDRVTRLRVANSDSDESTFDVLLTGIGMPLLPDITVFRGASTAPADELTDNVGTNVLTSVSINYSNAPQTFTIKNTGPGSLTGLTITKSGDTNDFVVSAPAATTLAMNATTTFTVTFAPKFGGVRNAVIAIASNDGDENPFEVNVSATALVPEISVEQPAGTSLDTGKIIGWGANNRGQIAPVIGLKAVATGREHAVGLRPDGTVLAWGNNFAGQTTVPAGASNIVAIAAWEDHSMALRSDGTVLAWGGDNGSQAHVPGGLNDIKGISTGIGHSLALRSNGTVVAWGANNIGQGNVPADLTNAVAISSGGDHNLALRSDGTVVAWGENDFGQNNVPAGLTGVVAISAGDAHSVVLKSDGTIVAWGRNDDGRCNAPSGAGFVAISAGDYNTAALRGDGAMFAWGNNSFGQTNIPTSLRGVKAIASGHFYTLAVADAVVDFGNQRVATTSAAKTFTIKNIDAGVMNITNVSIIGGNASDFALNTNGMLNILAPSNQTTVTVTFAPGALGVRTSMLRVLNNDRDENPFDIALTGTGTLPEISVFNGASTNAVDERFDNIGTNVMAATVGGSSSVQTFTVKNVGTDTLNGLALSISGTNASDFVLGLLGTNTLAPSATTTFTVTFTPAAAGDRNAVVAIASDDGDENPFEINMKGIGLTPEIGIDQPLGTPLADFDTKDFGAAVIGTSNALTFAVKNTGAGELVLSGTPKVAIGGANASEFTVTVQPGSPLQGGSEPAIALTNSGFEVPSYGGGGWNYNPGGSGWSFGSSAGLARNGSPWFVNPAPGGVQAAFIQRNASGDSAATLVRTNYFPTAGNYVVRFWAVRRGGGYQATDIDVWMGGDKLRTVSNASLSDDIWRVFTATYVCPAPGNYALSFVGTRAGSDYATAIDDVQIGDASTFQVQFAPTAAGVRTATLSIANNDADENPFHLTLTGTGLGAEISVFNGASTNAVDERFDNVGTNIFAATVVGNSTTQTFTIKNTGGANLTGLALTKSGANAADFVLGSLGATTLAPSESTSFIVRFAPTSGGERSALIAVASNDGDENPFEITVSGTGLAPEIAVFNGASTNAVDERTDNAGTNVFTATTVGNSSFVQTFTVKNVGVANLIGLAVAKSGAHNNDFSLSPLGTNILAPDATTSFTVTFTPTAEGTRNAVLFIASNDGDENPFEINVTGQGLAPEIYIEQTPGTPFVRGNMFAWGKNDYGQATIPAGLSNVVALGAGINHSSALKRDGTVTAWGDGPYGQTNVPAGLNSVRAIAVGDYNTIAIRSNGTVVSWGDSGWDQSLVPGGLTDVQSAAAGWGHCLASRSNGTVVTWGRLNSSGQMNVPAGLSGVVAVSAGYGFSAALRNNGTVAVWGDNTFGQTTVPASATNLMAIAAGDYFLLALRSNGTVVAWGRNESGQANVPFGVSNVVAIAAGDTHATAIRNDGTVFAWGHNGFGQVSGPNGLTGARFIAGGGPMTLAITDSSILFSNQLVGTMSDAITLTVSNLGAGTLNLSNVIVTGGHASDFAVNTSGTLSSVTASEQTTFSITFTPTAPGVRATTLRVFNNDSDENPYDILVSGAGIAPEIAVFNNASTNTVDERIDNVGTNVFAGTPIGSNSAPRTFTIKNVGSSPLAGLTLSVVGTNSGDFVISALGTNTLAPNVTTTFTVTFAPTGSGTRRAVLSIGSNDGDESSFKINLSGPVLAPELSIEQPFGTVVTNGAMKNFGPVTLGTGSNLTFALRNFGDWPLLLTGATRVAISGPNAADFTVVAQPSSSVAGEAVLLNGSFETPAGSAGSYGFGSASLPGSLWTFGLDAGIGNNGSPLFIPAAPHGVQAAFIRDDTAASYFSQSVNFPTPGQYVISFAVVHGWSNQSLPANNVVLRVDGATLLTVPASVQTNYAWSTYTAIYNCPSAGAHTIEFRGASSVSPNVGSAIDDVRITTANFQVNFTPSATGPRTATLTILNSDEDESSYSITLVGTGTTPEISVEQPAGTPIASGGSRDFGSLNFGEGTNLTFALRNLGDSDLLLTGTPRVEITGTNAADFIVLAQPDSPVAGGEAAIVLTNAGFEAPQRAAGTWAYNPPGTGWTFGSAAGVARTNSPWFVTNAVEGAQAAFIQLNTTNAFISRSIHFPAAGRYAIRFAIVRRGGGFQGNDIDVRMDGVSIGSVTNTIQSDDTWRYVSVIYTCTNAGNHTLAFVGMRGSPDNASAIDDIQITSATSFQVRFAPTASGARTALLSIANSDSDENPYTILLTGNGPAPQLPVIDAPSLRMLGNGAFQFTFNNSNNVPFTVLTSTNIALPISEWTVLGAATNSGGGVFQFTDNDATNSAHRFYQLRFP